MTAVKGRGVDEAAVTPTWIRRKRAPQRIRLGLAQHLARDRRRVAFAERQELHQVDERIAFGPAEVRVRDLSRLVADVQQQAGNRVGNRRAGRIAARGGRATSAPRDLQRVA